MLIVVNVLELLIAAVLAVFEFKRQGEDDYESDGVVALVKRGIDSQLSRSEREGTEAGREEAVCLTSLVDSRGG